MVRIFPGRVLLWTTLFCLAAGQDVARADDGFRCNGRVISTGEWLMRVIDKCGEPAAEMHRTEFRTIAVRVGNVIEERTVEVVIDELEYDLGSNRFVRFLYFENGRLLHVSTGEKGR
jgi:Protein of unknown function (DUF2845)